MQRDQRHWGIYRNQAAAGPSGKVDGFAVGSQPRERHRYRISDNYLDVGGGRPDPVGSGNARSPRLRARSWKTDANVRSRIAVHRRVFARYRSWLGAAIEGGADPSKIERGEVGSGGLYSALQGQNPPAHPLNTLF